MNTNEDVVGAENISYVADNTPVKSYVSQLVASIKHNKLNKYGKD